MSIRVAVLTLLVVALAIYAWRDWFKSLCGLIILMAVMEHPDMPKNIMGVQGFNTWNVLMGVILLAWLARRRREGAVWDMPGHVTVLLCMYLMVVLVAFGRMLGDRSMLPPEWTTGYIFGEHLVNSIKWVLPGLLVFDGCRDYNRMRLALGSILGLYVLLALLVIKTVPPSAIFGGGDLGDLRSNIEDNVGYHPVNMSMLLGGASWALLAAMPLWSKRKHRIAVMVTAVVVLYGQSLTGGRMGYATWAAVGLLMCALRWRKLLLLAPVVPFVLAVALPGAAARMLAGFDVQKDATGEEVVDTKTVTSSRDIAWPYVIDKIGESPVIGYGREAMVRTGLTALLHEELNEDFAHPHNAYLQAMMDSGLIGLVVVVSFYGLMIVYAARLFRNRESRWCTAIGGVCLALVSALLFAALGSQTFYPREGALGMWCAIGLMLRIHVQRRRMLQAGNDWSQPTS